MTPQEYIDRERHRAYINLKRANERGDKKSRRASGGEAGSAEEDRERP